MSLLTIAADMRELYEIRCALTRIAEALERLSPLLPAINDAATAKAGSASKEDQSLRFSFAESPEEYAARTSDEAALAVSLGFAPWSPAFERLLLDMKSDLMKPRMVIDEEGNRTEEALDEAAAEDVIRQSFQAAKAEANTDR